MMDNWRDPLSVSEQAANGGCTHGTTLGSYCHECTSPKPTTAELDFIAVLRQGADFCKNSAKANPRFVNEDVSLASMLDGAADRLEAAAALIKDIGELPAEWLANKRPESDGDFADEEAREQCAKYLQAKLKEHGHG